MKFSIITVCKNDESRIKKTIDSVIGQSFLEYEYLIKDGGSTDNTFDICSKAARNDTLNRITVYSSMDNGIYYAMNEALSYSSGDYICFMNSGDRFHDSGVLACVNNFINDNPGYDIYYGDAKTVFGDGALFRLIFAPNEKTLVEANRLECANLGLIHQTLFVSNKCFSKCKFDTSYSLRSELDWYYQCIKKGFRYKKIPQIICEYERGGLSDNPESVKINTLETTQILRKNGFNTDKYIERLLKSRERDVSIKFVYSMWIELIHNGYDLGEYLYGAGFKRVAIYGCGEVGNLLYRELINSSVEVKFFIDRLRIGQISELKVIAPSELYAYKNIDLVIVTAVNEYRNIMNENKQVGIPFVSIFNLLNDLLKMK
ncbi:glycosyltransferase [Butyrivibrio sp. MB2005]|uniref:glycosyltransferase n=1 Tax=Butyrivibrio sp. MB2005 TaxID=1280678 RepID=UPI00041ADACB|nr:glycosyltransferase [Butyrivibrio sp. MB2005]